MEWIFFLQSVNGDTHVRLNGKEIRRIRRSKAKDEEGEESLYSLYSTNSPNSSHTHIHYTPNSNLTEARGGRERKST